MKCRRAPVEIHGGSFESREFLGLPAFLFRADPQNLRPLLMKMA